MKRLAVLSLLLAAACGGERKPQPIRDGWILVYEIQGDAAPETVATVVRARLAALFGKGFEVRTPEDGTVELLLGTDVPPWQRDRVKDLLTRPGTCELRIVALPPGALPGRPGPETEERRKREGSGGAYAGPPEGTEWVPSLHGEEDDRLLETPGEARWRFTGADFDRGAFSVMPSHSGAGWLLDFAMRGDRVGDFGDFTEANLKRQMAIVVDGRVISAPIIQQRLPGGGRISGGGVGGFRKVEAEDLAAVLSCAPLPAKLVLRREGPIEDEEEP